MSSLDSTKENFEIKVVKADFKILLDRKHFW